MSDEKKARFKRIDKAINQVRIEVDEVIDESKEAGGEARADVREAIDDAKLGSKNSEPGLTNNTAPNSS